MLESLLQKPEYDAVHPEHDGVHPEHDDVDTEHDAVHPEQHFQGRTPHLLAV